jgi:DNA-binding MarR family transcriptional regulator
VTLGPEPAAMDIQKDHRSSRAHGAKHVDADAFHEPDFVLVQDFRPPPRIEMARERMLMCRLYLGLIRSMTEDYGAAFAAHNDSSTFRTIGIYVFLRTVMCSPVGAGKIANALKLPRVTVVRRLQEMLKLGYVERVGNAYRVTDKVNIPDLKNKLQRRMDMIVETARRLSELNGSTDLGPVANEDVQASRTGVI